LASTLTVTEFIRTKANEKHLEIRKRECIHGLSIFRVPPLSQERAKLRISNFACTFMDSIRTTVH